MKAVRRHTWPLRPPLSHGTERVTVSGTMQIAEQLQVLSELQAV